MVFCRPESQLAPGPIRLVAQEPGNEAQLRGFRRYYRPVHVKRFTIITVPEASTVFVARSRARAEADIMYFVPVELKSTRVKNNPNPSAGARSVYTGSLWASNSRLSRIPKNPFP